VPNHEGWFGMHRELLHYLDIVGADKGTDGKFILSGAPPTSFMGAGEEICVPEETVYFCAGEPKKLAAALRTTSYGLAVKVF
jgi:hypothetical protein